MADKKIKITYIGHSGFSAELESCVLIFDYYKGKVPSFLKEKPVYVFSSHRHHDHFKKVIFDWQDRYPDIHYILSDDIKAGTSEECTTYIGPGQEVREGMCLIRTLKSTDEGVAFLVKAEGITIYHAGDLNWWHWEEESEAYNEMMRRNYQYEISKLHGEKIDAAFVPVDGRLGEQYYYGLDWFMKETDTSYVFPMHFWGDFKVCEKILDDPHTQDYRERIAEITEEGQVFQIKI